MWKLLAGAAVAGAAVVLLAGLRTAVDRARFLQRAGLGLIVVFTLVGGAWIAAEAFTDPGGWQAAGRVALCLTPLFALSAIAWYRDAGASVLLTGLAAVVVGMSAWFAADPLTWRAFENDNGPVRAISVFVLAAPMAVLGRSRSLPAGLLLVVLGTVPVALSALGSTDGLGSLAAVTAPLLLAGILYLLAHAAAEQTSTPAAVPTAAAQR